MDIPDQLHQAAKMLIKVWASVKLFAIITASSANCSHVQDCGASLGPQMYPRFVSSGFSSVCINVLKHRLKRSGESGSPCRTPLFTLNWLVQLLFTATYIAESLYMLLKTSVINSGRW